MAYTVEDCARTAEVLRQALAHLPKSARAVRATVRTIAREHETAVRVYGYAEEQGLDAEIVAAGSIGQGESVMFAAGRAEVRRVSETGIEINSGGFWEWHNLSSRTTPMVAVSHDLDDGGAR